MDDNKYKMLSKFRVRELKAAWITNMQYRDDIQDIYGDETYSELNEIMYTAPSGYFIWKLMNAEAVKKFYDKDPENRGLILDETDTSLSDYIEYGEDIDDEEEDE